MSEAHRVAMIELCCQENNRLHPELIELSLPAPSYTVKTLRAMRQQSQDTICFFIGADSLYNLDKWYEWEQLLDYCHLVVMRRDGETFSPPNAVKLWLEKHKAHDISVINARKNGAVLLIDTPLYSISSTEIRNAMTQTSATDITTSSDWVPGSVLNYIKEHQLYKS
ncbi:nicotinate-nucleotide adenylyltransferase [Alteromonas sp. D210916BOD_24]